jgi:hypothetical protein
MSIDPIGDLRLRRFAGRNPLDQGGMSETCLENGLILATGVRGVGSAIRPSFGENDDFSCQIDTFWSN